MSRRVAAVVVVALVIIAGLVYWFAGRESNPPTAVAQRGSIDVTIQTVGSLQTGNAELTRSQVAGVVTQLGAQAGNQVQAGDILVLLDRAPFERAVDDAQQRLTNAEFALQAAERNQQDNPDDDQARLDALNAGQAVEVAQQALRDAQTALGNSAIVAGASGTLLELQVNIGDTVGPDQPIARIGNPADYQIIADVDELDLPNVKPGAAARFRLDAYPAAEIDGVVRDIAPEARRQGGTTVFATTIDFDPPAGLDLRPGMNADVTIVTAARENALLIPESALKTVGERTFVTVVENGKQTEREVKIGYRGNGQVEIVDGLSEGDRVLLR